MDMAQNVLGNLGELVCFLFHAREVCVCVCVSFSRVPFGGGLKGESKEHYAILGLPDMTLTQIWGLLQNTV